MNKKLAERLAQLRLEKGVSARDMSLSLGQSAGYINNIENGNNLPSMTVFFYICEYLDISPRDFFDYEVESPRRLGGIINDLRKLSPAQLEHLSAIIGDIVN